MCIIRGTGSQGCDEVIEFTAGDDGDARSLCSCGVSLVADAS